MAKEAKVDYDAENDILYVYSGENAKDSLEMDNFVIDFSADNKVVGVEIFDASNIAGKMIDAEVSREDLSNASGARISSYQSKELSYIIVIFTLKVNNEEKEISLPIPSPAAVLAHR